MTTAYEKNYELPERLSRRGLTVTEDQASTLRRAELTLTRWAEAECGDGNGYSAWAIERDEMTGKPFRCVYPNSGPMHRYPVPDREAGALRRVARLCKDAGLYYFHQTDPRGAALYVAAAPLTGQNYTDGVSCHVGG